jgi:SAM-dependent methyltransferase
MSISSAGMAADNHHVWLSPQEIEAVLSPWIKKRFIGREPEWRQHLRQRQIELNWRLAKRRLLAVLPGTKRTQKVVYDSYNTKWASRYFPSPDQANQKREASYVHFGDGGLLLKVGGIPLMHSLMIAKIIDQLKPRRVIEVGCGYGTNLFGLAAAYPEIHFVGAELTQSGVEKAKSIVAEPVLPEPVRRYTALPVKDETAYRRIEFVQANAAKLPFANNEFDLVFTRQALEQMNEVRHEAVAELARISSNHVLMFEPFAEFNRNSIRQAYIRSMDYFQMSLQELKQHGLSPVCIFDRFPAKVALGIQMVLTVKTSTSP